MNRITGKDRDETRQYFELAAGVAKRAQCRKAKCGTVIVKGGEIIGQGSNGPAANDESSRACNNTYDYSIKPKYDKTCCIHAEWRAILDACKRNAGKIDGSILYFMRIDNDGNFTDAGKPYCTVCSRLALESGISYFALWNNDGVDMYTTAEYNQISYDFHKPVL